MPLNFPSTPALNETYSFNNRIWKWNGEGWQLLSAPSVVNFAVGTDVSDVFDASGTTLIAKDPGADRLVFWDYSAGKITHLSVGTGLTITDTEITSSGGGMNGLASSLTF